MIKAVIFDIDGVLIDSLEANYQYYIALFKMFGMNFLSREEYKKNYYSMPTKEVMRKLMNISGQKLDEKFEMVKENAPYLENLYKVPEGEQDTINNLSKKYKLGIVTGRYGVASTFSVIGLKDCFSAVVKFGDYEKPKPDPEPLLIAAKRLGVRPTEAVYIGDSKDDVIAAKAAGMHFITFFGVVGKQFKEADANIGSFKELPGVIENL